MRAASISQACLPTPEKTTRESWLRCGAADALQLAAGDDVEAAAELREELEDGERGVGFDGVADGVVDAAELAREHGDALADVVGGVDVERCAELRCEVA